MATGFHVYIDESGDEGFKFDQPGRNSSKWFVLSAVVTRAENDMEVVTLVDRIRTLLKKPPRKPLHFTYLKHEHRLPYVDAIGNAQLRTVNVIIHKPSIREPERFTSKPHLLYRFAARLLLERVSWLCRDTRKNPDDTARILFSNRSCMSYDELREYFKGLQEQTSDFEVQIDWSVFNPDKIEARTHDSMMGLQIADAVASSYFLACELQPTGFSEPRYASMLKKVVYRNNKKICIGNGIKFWPLDHKAFTEPHILWVNEMGK